MTFPDFKIGVGTWAWGERLIWKYGEDYREEDLNQVFHRSLQDGVHFFATSETFADGNAEKLLGKFILQTSRPCFISTKFAPRIWRPRRSDFINALKASIIRLNQKALDIYQILPPTGLMTVERLAEYAAEAMDTGLIKRIGLSNYSAEHIAQIAELVSRFGFKIDCLETEYNLLNREIERNGVLDICDQFGIRVIAQNPLAMGLLSGKYTLSPMPKDNRGALMEKYHYPALALLHRVLTNIGSDQEAKTSAQVALNWIMRKGIIPIPGAKNLRQVSENNLSIGWKLTDEQMDLLDAISDKVTNQQSKI